MPDYLFSVFKMTGASGASGHSLLRRAHDVLASRSLGPASNRVFCAFFASRRECSASTKIFHLGWVDRDVRRRET
jgi:hypothetical protein